jgi:hypothetical protein
VGVAYCWVGFKKKPLQRALKSLKIHIFGAFGPWGLLIVEVMVLLLFVFTVCCCLLLNPHQKKYDPAKEKAIFF